MTYAMVNTTGCGDAFFAGALWAAAGEAKRPVHAAPWPGYGRPVRGGPPLRIPYISPRPCRISWKNIIRRPVPMSFAEYLWVSDEVRQALADHQPVVALESHHLPRYALSPERGDRLAGGKDRARQRCAARHHRHPPGQALRGHLPEQIEYLGKKGLAVSKASRRDLRCCWPGARMGPPPWPPP